MDCGSIGQVLGGYRLDQLLGSGGMGDVFLAHRVDGVIEKTAAVKVYRLACKEACLDEAGTLRRLRHPKIAEYLADGLSDDGHPYLVLEYVDGIPITEYADQRKLSIHGRLCLFLQACDAIEYAHESPVVHLDLKPANILVAADGAVKVIDFGIAQRLDEDRAAEPSNAVSLPYASPEQLQAGGKPGVKADIYSLGAVLYELLCGHQPFNPRLAPGELERQILEETPRRPSSAIGQPRLKQSDSGKYVSLEPEKNATLRGGCRPSEARRLLAGGLDGICLYALRKEPERRYTSADDLKSDIQRVVEGRNPSIARPDSLLYLVLRLARRAPVPLQAVVLATVMIYSSDLLRSFSAATHAGVDNTRKADEATDSSLRELKEELRPKLAADPRLSRSLKTLDAAWEADAPVHVGQTLWGRFIHYFESSARYNRRR